MKVFTFLMQQTAFRMNTVKNFSGGVDKYLKTKELKTYKRCTKEVKPMLAMVLVLPIKHYNFYMNVMNQKLSTA